MIKNITAIALASLPGVLLIWTGNARSGMTALIFGFVVGLLYVAGGVSPSRTFRLFISSLLAKNIPLVGSRTIEWVDQDLPLNQGAKEDNDWLSQWLFASHQPTGDRKKVVAGLVLGLLAGIAVSFHDLRNPSPGQGWFLPLRGAKDSLLTQSCLVAIGFAIWGSALGGILTSAIYRRMLPVAIIAVMIFSGSVAISVSSGSHSSPLAFTTFFTTAGIAGATLFSWIFDTVESTTSD